MPSNNYSAWTLDPSSFDSLSPGQRLDFLIRFAVLAPSSHNSQPWKFAVNHEGIIASADMARALPQSDANHRQLYLSLGCAIENICLAAEYYGYSVAVTAAGTVSEPTFRIFLQGQPVPAASRRADHPALFIAKRRTNRNKYDTRMPEASFLSWMRELSNVDMDVVQISENPLKSDVAAVVSDALIEAMDDTGFRKELSGYIHPNITKAMTGMPMFGFGMPTPLSFIAPALLKRVNVNRASRPQDEALLREHTPMFVVISTSLDNPAAWVRAGRAYERIALEAERRGISTAPMAAAIQIGNHFERLKALLKTELRPQMFFRVGYAQGAPSHSPRLTAEQVIHA